MTITLAMMRQHFYSAVVADALDTVGCRRQSPSIPLPPLTSEIVLVGRCKTTLWAEMAHTDPDPYALELQAIDSCSEDDVFIAAANGCMSSGLWGELLSTAARRTGCVGAIIDGACRDLTKIRAMAFPVFARGTSVYDSKDRARVIDVDVPVAIDGVLFSPGDLVIADVDGVVVVPQRVETEVVQRAWEKVHAENEVRDAIANGMSATEAFRKFGVL